MTTSKHGREESVLNVQSDSRNQIYLANRTILSCLSESVLKTVCQRTPRLSGTGLGHTLTLKCNPLTIIVFPWRGLPFHFDI
jgi:hypothetical protein